MSGMDKSSSDFTGENTSLPTAQNTIASQQGVLETKRIVYRSEIMRQLMRMVDRVAPSNATVLILGESGTGKELIANAIHERSNRRNKPFVAINCGALRETLLE